TPDHERVSVEIPAGVHSGQSISITGKGEAGVRGETSGDLIVTIEVAQHKDFERRGDDLFTSVSVDSLEAIVGTTVTIDGIIKDESIELSIPAGCKYGQQLSVAGKGMPRLHSKARGNLYVLVHIETSTGLTTDQLEMLTTLIDERKQNSAQETQDNQHGNQSSAKDFTADKDKNAKKASKKRR
ncbi:MAG: molecular chaperone DnaJ, partial [Atopobium sp.]|nr:molecular chaperone DnaJ [Atopobium sp.]